MPPLLCNDEPRELLALARAVITETILYDRLPDMPVMSGRLNEPGGAFVTLFHRGRLRGCVGIAGRDLRLGEAVVQSAIGAARSDPRFAAVAPAELPNLEIEISVLSEVLPIAPDAVTAGLHGLLVVRGKNRGLVLPQVAVEHGWPALRFLRETCRKAGLQPEAWRDPETKVMAFTAEVFSEKYSGSVAKGGAERRPGQARPKTPLAKS